MMIFYELIIDLNITEIDINIVQFYNKNIMIHLQKSCYKYNSRFEMDIRNIIERLYYVSLKVFMGT